MNIEKYHANLSYPVVNGLNYNKVQAMLLMEGYSGQFSELSTVIQYSYHKIKSMKNREIAETLQGIFLVETHHLELLGNCINQLGMDPRYYIYLNQKPIVWQADVVNYATSVKEMVLADIEGEKRAVQYYIETAKIIDNEKIAKLLLRLSEDEKLHVEIFTNLYHKYFR